MTERQKQAAAVAGRRQRMIRFRNIAIVTVAIITLVAGLAWISVNQAKQQELAALKEEKFSFNA